MLAFIHNSIYANINVDTYRNNYVGIYVNTQRPKNNIINMNTKTISILSQKGGCGKSSLTCILASYLAYTKKKKVLVLDADYPQHTFSKWRSDDLELMDMMETVKAQFGAQGIPAYEIIGCDINQGGQVMYVLDVLEKARGLFDYVLIDLPGTFNNNNLGNILANIDIMLVPFTDAKETFRSSFESLIILFNMKQSMGLDQKIYAFWNQYYSQMNKEFFEALEAELKKTPLTGILQNKVGNSRKIFNRECRNTMFPPRKAFLDQKGTGINIGGFLSEIYKIVK